MEELQQPHLPVEILLQILEVLLQRHDRRSLLRVCLCCKAFQRVTEPILYQIYSITLNTSVASTSYLSINARNAPHVRDVKMLVRWENARSPQFQEPPMEVLCNVRRLKVTLSSDFPAETEYYNRIWDALSRIPSGCLRSFRYCPQMMPTGNMLTKLCDSLRAQFELQELSLISDWGNTYPISLRGYPLSTRFPKLRVVEGPSSVQKDHPNVTHFLWNYLDSEHALSHVQQSTNFSQLTLLRVNQLNSHSTQVLEELARCCPNLERLGIFSFHSDNRGMIMGQNLWSWMHKLPKLQGISVMVQQKEDFANKTLEEIIQLSPARVRKIRAAIPSAQLCKLREYSRIADSSGFETTFELTYSYVWRQQDAPLPNPWHFCDFKSDIIEGHFL